MGMTPTQARQLGALIAKARARAGVSLRELASHVGVHSSWIGFVEQGRFVDPAPDRLARLAEALDVEPARIDRIAKGALAGGLPGMRTYFRAKYDLTPDQAAQVERYVKRLRKAP